MFHALMVALPFSGYGNSFNFLSDGEAQLARQCWREEHRNKHNFLSGLLLIESLSICYCNLLLSACRRESLKMSSNSGIFFRTLPSGVKLYLRDSATNGSWRRVPGLSDEEYFSKVVGDRVNEEVANRKGDVEAKSSKTVNHVVIEYAADGSLLSQKLNHVRDGFHESPSDVVPHAGVVYESSTGEHLSKKQIAEKKEDQAEVSP